MIRILMWLTIGFAAACALCTWCFTPWLAAVAAFGLLLALLSLLWIKYKAARVVGTLFLGVALGIGWFFCLDACRYSGARDFDGSEQKISVEASGYSYETDYGTAVEGYVRLEGKKYRILLFREEITEVKPGDTVTCDARLRFTGYGGINAPTYHSGNGILLLGYVLSPETLDPVPSVPAKYLPAFLRRELLHRIDACFSEDTAAFAKALLLGERAEMDYQTNTAFKVSGVSHIIAVSGLHLSILFAVVYWLTGHNRFLAAILGVPVALLFAAVVGFTPSVTRACIMQILIVLAMAFDQEYDPATSLSFAALVMLIAEPMVITSVSFQLSFGCVAGILLFSSRIKSWFVMLRPWRRWNGKSIPGRLVRIVGTSLSVSVGSMVFTTPLVALYFGTVSLIGVVTNMLILWVVTLVFYGIMAVCFFSLFWVKGAELLAVGCGWLIRFVLAVTRALAAFPLAAVYTKSLYIVAWLVLCYGLLTIFLAFRRRQPYVLICCGTIGLCVALLCSWLEPLTDDMRLTMLDVGQGQSLILQSDGKTFLIDCGGDRAEDAADLAAETLLSQGITRLDGLILTHYDRDHAGGVEYLLSRIPAERVYLPDAPDTDETMEGILSAAADKAFFVTSDQILTWQETAVTVFAPLLQGDDNESGLCILFEKENCDILITGDLSSYGESLLCAYTDLPQLTLLVAGHHGSKYSASETLLSATTPEYAFISVGENSYGHPAAETLERLLAAGCKIYRTDLSGTIIFRR